MVLSAAALARKAALLCAGVFAVASCASSFAFSFAESALVHLTHSSAKTTAALESDDATFFGAAAFFEDLDLAAGDCLAAAGAVFLGWAVFLPFLGEDACSTVACLRAPRFEIVESDDA